MARQRVKSTSIQSVDYVHGNGILDVEFHNGSRYKYFGVPDTVYNTLMAAKSIGQYFATHIRGQYKSEKVEKA